MLTHIRRRRVLLAALAGATLAALGLTVASSHATASATPLELLQSAKTVAPLKAGITYQASSFPIPLRLTPADRTWLGAQHLTGSHGRPAFGRVDAAHPPVSKPLGAIEIETAIGPTPSVNATIADLRFGGSSLPETHTGGVEFGRPSAVKVAGFAGRQFDGQVWGKFGHSFLPFSPHVRGPASPPDTIYLGKGEAFRMIVLNVRGKTVVLALESFGLPAEQFPDFLTSANLLLKTLRFPAS
jgi:hypothetical protein